MNTRSIYILILLALLSGCASDPLAEQKQATKLMEYKIQVYGPACEKLGFEIDTDAWRECIQMEYQQTIIRREQQWNYPYWNPYYMRPYYR
jgi:hypothetical protein